MDGILVIDKPQGPTSHDVVSRARRILKEKRIGHTGTLDPFATGVLVLMVGQATRLAQFLNTDEKEYEATIRFGYSTDTGDLTGTRNSPDYGREIQSSDLSGISISQLESALAQLRGEIRQVPPMYSAKKIAGRKLYELAREGQVVERQPVPVTISSFEITSDLKLDDHDGPRSPLTVNSDGTADVKVKVVCSAGTYIRTLAEDLGTLLGTRAHLIALRRNRAGTFRIENSVTLDRLSEAAETGTDLSELILSPTSALPRMPFMHLSVEDARSVRHGRNISAALLSEVGIPDGQPVRLHDGDDVLIAIGYFDKSKSIVSPRIVLALEN
jgi:tRNA pseudouridine55 synthase